MRSTAEMLERQVGQLARLVEDLLDVNRITHGKIELRKTRTALGPIVQQAVDAAYPLCRSMGHEFTVTMPALESTRSQVSAASSASRSPDE